MKRLLAILVMLACGVMAAERMVPRVIDIRRLPARLAGGKASQTKHEDGTIDVRGEKGQKHCVIFDLGSLSDYRIATHLDFEVALVSGYNSKMGFTLSQDFSDEFTYGRWRGLEPPGKDGPAFGEEFLFETPYDMANTTHNLTSLTFYSTGRQERVYRIRSLRLIFRPEVVLETVSRRLAILSRQKLNEAERQQAQALEAALAKAYEAVSGSLCEPVSHQAAMDFLKTAHRVKEESRRQLRSHGVRLAFQVTTREYGVAMADSMDAVFLEGPGTELRTGEWTMGLAANEVECFQTVVMAGKEPLKGVRVEVGPFQEPGGEALQADEFLIAHNRTVSAEYVSEYKGFYPDVILLDQKTAEIKPGETVPFWIQVRAPRGTAPGTYHAMVTVSAQGQPDYQFPLTVKVYGFTLPEGTVLPMCYSFGIKQLDSFYQLKRGTRHRMDMVSKLVDLAADYRIFYDQLYKTHIEEEDREELYYSQLKRLDERGQLRQFCLWLLDFAATAHGHPRFESALQKDLDFLKKHVEIVRKLGLLPKAYIYGWDEFYTNPVSEVMCETIKRAYPDLPIVSTMAFGDPDEMPNSRGLDVFCPIAPTFDRRHDRVARYRAKGCKVYWYVCNTPRPPYPTFMLDVPGAVPRLLMGMMTEKFKPDGFLYYSVVSAWHNNTRKIGRTVRTAWNTNRRDSRSALPENADGTLFYPGENDMLYPSIRAANYRDGIEDHWYYELIRRCLKAGKGTAQLRRRAEELLTVPECLVRNTGDYSTDSRLIRHERQKLAMVLEELVAK